MAGYYIEIIVDSSRLTNKYKQQHEEYFLNPTYAHIIETPEMSQHMKKRMIESCMKKVLFRQNLQVFND